MKMNRLFVSGCLVLALALLAGCTTVEAEPIVSDDEPVVAADGDADVDVKHVVLSGDEVAGIKAILPMDEFAEVEAGLPIGVYGLRMDEPGSYRWVVSRIYPVYAGGAIDGIVIQPGEDGLYKRPGEGSIYDELMERLGTGGCGSIAIITAADGTYLYDGSTIERLNDSGDALYFGMGEQTDTGFVALESVELPDEVLAEVGLTDTGVTAALG